MIHLKQSRDGYNYGFQGSDVTSCNKDSEREEIHLTYSYIIITVSKGIIGVTSLIEAIISSFSSLA